MPNRLWLRRVRRQTSTRHACHGLAQHPDIPVMVAATCTASRVIGQRCHGGDGQPRHPCLWAPRLGRGPRCGTRPASAGKGERDSDVIPSWVGHDICVALAPAHPSEINLPGVPLCHLTPWGVGGSPRVLRLRKSGVQSRGRALARAGVGTRPHLGLGGESPLTPKPHGLAVGGSGTPHGRAGYRTAGVLGACPYTPPPPWGPGPALR